MPQRSPQFAAAVDVVRLDVVVTDSDGQFIRDLAASDFTVFEDGSPRELIDVQLVDVSTGTVRSLIESTEDRESPQIARSASDLGAIIFFLDFPGLYFQNKIRFADSLLEVLGDISEVDVPHAVYLVDLAGDLHELVTLTRDIDTLRVAAQQVRSLPLVQTRDDLLALLEGDEGGLTRWSQRQQRERALETYELLTAFVDGLVARPGRKALVWVSTGVDLAAYETVSRTREGPAGDFRFYSVDETRTAAQRGLHDAANAANVSIYTVDPSRLDEFATLGVSTRAGSAADARGNSLRDAASATGGKSFIAWSELNRVLDEIETDARSFYLLTFAYSHEPTVDEYHELRVEVLRPDAEVRARQGYVRGTNDSRRRKMIGGALRFPGIVTGLAVETDGIAACDADGRELLVVAASVGIPVRSESAESGPSAPLQLFAMARDRAGTLVAHAEESLRSELRSAPGQVSHQVRWAIPPGEYRINVAVLDPQTGAMGAAAFDKTIPELDGQWQMSDPALLLPRPNGGMSVAVGGRIYGDLSPIVYVEVYNGNRPTVAAQVLSGAASPQAELSDASEALGTAATLQRDGNIHRGSVEVSPSPVAGEYHIRVVVEDEELGIRRVAMLPLRVMRRD